MAIPVLATKLYLPPPPPKAVTRTHLLEQLDAGLCQNQGAGRILTLISAPAGFGKSTLIGAWAAGCARKVAWLTLDEADSDPLRFLTYFVAAFRSVAPDHAGAVLLSLQAPQPPAVEQLLTDLLNEIAAIPERFILVLDDYHRIDSRAVDTAVAFLLEHLPPNLRLVITTREDPHLPLARLRARGQLTELRAGDLRFSATEIAGFLYSMDLELCPEDIEILERRTEGWIAGLQLAALALQGSLSAPGRPDASAFIQAFAGDHRYIVDYLVEEVLQHQPEAARSFLLQTSILDQLCAPLCAAVTGQQESHARLEALERGNFFLIPLDDRRRWYRYHHLFAQVLHAYLLAEQPDLAPLLHRRAAQWYAQQGQPVEAIRHALRGKDFDDAARLVELATAGMRQNRQEGVLLGWFKALPDTVIRLRPVLSVGYAGAMLASGEIEGVEERLRDAERWVDTTVQASLRPEAGAAGVVVVDEAEFRRLPGQIALYRAAPALAQGNQDRAIHYARMALDLTAPDDYLGIGAANAILGLAYWANGDLEPAYRIYTDGMASVQKAGHQADTIASAITQADIRIVQGRLRQALRIYEQGLAAAGEPGGAVLRGAADMHVGISQVLLEYNQCEAALQHLLRCRELGEHNGFPQNRYRRRVAMARVQAAGGDLDAAQDLLAEAEVVFWSDFSPNVRPIPALRARIWVAQGRLEQALDWAGRRGVSTGDDLSYLHEYEHITLARVLLAVYRRDRTPATLAQAVDFLERLLQAAQDGGRAGSEIEILILLALAHSMNGDCSAALKPLERALRLAEPEGYLRIFIDEGRPMLQLLQEAAGSGISPDYTQSLLSAFQIRMPGDAAAPAPAPRPASQPLVEPLSQREMEILRLFRSELSGPEIARHLVIALSTLRTHTKSIYSKLNVNSRRAAVKRAEDLDLI